MFDELDDLLNEANALSEEYDSIKPEIYTSDDESTSGDNANSLNSSNSQFGSGFSVDEVSKSFKSSQVKKIAFSFSGTSRFPKQSVSDRGEDTREFLGQKNYCDDKKFDKSFKAQFPSSKRFSEKSDQTAYDTSNRLHPKYDIKYKKVQGFAIAKKNKYRQEQRRKLKQKKVKKMKNMDPNMSQALKKELDSSLLTADGTQLQDSVMLVDSFLQNM